MAPRPLGGVRGPAPLAQTFGLPIAQQKTAEAKNISKPFSSVSPSGQPIGSSNPGTSLVSAPPAGFNISGPTSTTATTAQPVAQAGSGTPIGAAASQWMAQQNPLSPGSPLGITAAPITKPAMPQPIEMPTAPPVKVEEKKTTTMAPAEAGVQTPGLRADSNAQPGEVGADGKVVAAPADGAAAGGTAGGTPFSDSLSDFEAKAKAWMQGTDDTVFRNAANRVIQSLGLMNQAERDALAMQINQDPTLKGQGAGMAMLSMLSRDQNFRMDQMMGQLSSESMTRILDLQKYGFEASTKINDVRYQRTQETIRNLVSTGNFQGAANLMQAAMDKDYAGLGITVSAEEMKKRDPLALEQFKTRMDFAKELATRDPAAAAALFNTMINDPAYKDWFPEGATGEQMATLVQSGRLEENLAISQKLSTEINTIAAAKQSFDEASSLLKEYFTATGRNAAVEGRRLSLEDINALRARDGLPAFTKDAAGNIVDDLGNVLDDTDFSDLGMRNEFYDRTDKAGETPWKSVMDMLLKTENGAKFLDEAAFPGVTGALEGVLVNLYFGGGLIQDPQTGQVTIDATKFNLGSFDQNNTVYPLIYTWPKAAFDPKTGKTVGAYDMGGDVYDDTLKPDAEDAGLDEKYFSYLRTGGSLSPREWYFATASGTLAPNKANIPADAKPETPDLGGGQDVADTEVILTKARKGETLTPEEESALIGSGIIATYNAVKDLTSAGIQSIINENAGLVQFGGKLIKVVKAFGNGFLFEYGGKLYGVNSGGEYWSPTSQNASGDVAGPSIANPLTGAAAPTGTGYTSTAGGTVARGFGT